MNRCVKKVAVIGFGSAGAASAIQLKKEGFEVEVFERAPRIGPIGAGILLHPSGQKVLEKFQILDSVTSRSEPIQSIHVRTVKNKSLLNIRYDEAVVGRTAYGVERTTLFDALEKEALRLNIPFHLGQEIKSLDVQNDGINFVSNANQQFGPFDTVVLSDGAQSNLRSSVVAWSYPWRYQYGARWTIGKCSKAGGSLHQLVHGTKHLIGILPTGNGRASFFWGTSPGEDKSGFETWKRKALSLCPDAFELLDPLTSFDQLIDTKYIHLFSSQSRYDSVVLLGDAWHAMSPHLGQGTNLALLDGYVFAKLLSMHNGDLIRTNKEFRVTRIGNNFTYSLLSLLFSPLFQSGGIMKGIVRDIGLPIVSNIPFIRRHMVLSICGLKKNLMSLEELEIL